MPALPVARSNNAVAAVLTPTGVAVVSALGLAPGKLWSDVVSDAWSLGTSGWRPLPAVPGPGRLASVALGIDDRLLLIGGYTVGADHTEVSRPGIDVWSVSSGAWSVGPVMPIPVDDAVASVWRNRWVVLVSGWSNDDNVSDVQLLDLEDGSWHEGTPIPGAAVFGHAGAMWNDTLVYCDGVRVVPASGEARRSFVANAGCYLGQFGDDVGAIEWRSVPPHPGVARYRMAAGAAKGLVVFAGGTDNPYNYDGLGYDGTPAAPTNTAFAWDVAAKRWVDLPPLPEPSMDHRGLVNVEGDLVLVGGLNAKREPTNRVWRLVGL
ncbi:MAG: Kelch repeat-containing protein [Nannocystales bacterium]